jgi:hypothetical protein
MAEQNRVNEAPIEKTPLEAKGGIELFRNRYILLISFGLTVLGLIVAFLIFGKY